MTFKEQLHPHQASPRTRAKTAYDTLPDGDDQASLLRDEIPAEVEARAGGELNSGDIGDIVAAAVAELDRAGEGKGKGKGKSMPAHDLDKIIATVTLAHRGTPNPTAAEKSGHHDDSDEEKAYNGTEHSKEHDKKDAKPHLTPKQIKAILSSLKSLGMPEEESGWVTAAFIRHYGLDA